MRKRKTVAKIRWNTQDFAMAESHFCGGYTYAAIAEGYGISRQRVHQRIERLKKALARA